MAESRKKAVPAAPAESTRPGRAASPIAAAARARAAEVDKATATAPTAKRVSTTKAAPPKAPAKAAAPRAAPKAAHKAAPAEAAPKTWSQAAPAPVVETAAADVAPAPAPAPSRSGGPLGPIERLGARTLAVTSVVLLLLVLLLGALALVRGGGDGGAKDREAARADSLAAGKAFALALTTYDYRTLDKNIATVEAGATGKFKDDYTKTTAALKSALTKAKAVSQPTILGAGVEEVTDGRSTVVLFLDQKITNATSPQPRVDRNRIVLMLQEVDGAWLVNDVSLT